MLHWLHTSIRPKYQLAVSLLLMIVLVHQSNLACTDMKDSPSKPRLFDHSIYILVHKPNITYVQNNFWTQLLEEYWWTVWNMCDEPSVRRLFVFFDTCPSFYLIVFCQQEKENHVIIFHTMIRKTFEHRDEHCCVVRSHLVSKMLCAFESPSDCLGNGYVRYMALTDCTTPWGSG